MKTLWDLIYKWKGQRDEAERIEAQASRSRDEADALEAELRSELIRHGPIINGAEVYLPPLGPDAPIRILPALEAMNVSLSESETPNPEGGTA